MKLSSAVMVMAVLLLASAASAQPREATVKIALDKRLGPMLIERMALGQGGLSDEPMWDDRTTEIRALRPAIIRLFIQEYFRLLPERGRYHFETLDRSVNTILAAGATPVMCICFKPAVLFPKVNQDIVEPNDYDQWEQLVFALVKHYRDAGAAVRYWEVSNEPDIGESGGCPYRFKPDSYVRYYRRTAAAIRRADPAALVGGPAVSSVQSPILPALIDACRRESLPLNFVSWHIYSSSPGAIRQTVDHVRGLLKKYPAPKPETMLNEWNMDLGNPPLDPRFQPCFIAETIWQMKEAGLDWSCYYQIRERHVEIDQFAPFMSPDGAAFMTRWWNRMPQFDGLFDYQNTVRPSYFAFKLLSRLGGDRLAVASSDAAVHGFAAHDERLKIDTMVVWNFSPSPANVDLQFSKIARPSRLRHITLDATTGSSDENHRLRPDPSTDIPKGDHRVRLTMEPYAVHYWSLE